jgi:hypothetical protein
LLIYIGRCWQVVVAQRLIQVCLYIQSYVKDFLWITATCYKRPVWVINNQSKFKFYQEPLSNGPFFRPQGWSFYIGLNVLLNWKSDVKFEILCTTFSCWLAYHLQLLVGIPPGVCIPQVDNCWCRVYTVIILILIYTKKMTQW